MSGIGWPTEKVAHYYFPSCLLVPFSEKENMLVSKSQKQGYNFYTLTCGHTVEIFSGNYNKGVYRCPECFINKQRQSADQAGLYLVEYRKKPFKSLFKFKSCGHSKEIDNSQVATKQVFCDDCHEHRLSDILDRCNFKLVSKEGQTLVIECTVCLQQEKRKSSILMYKGSVRCETCYKNTCYSGMTSRLLENNITLIDKTSDKDYGLFKLPCGCLKTMQYAAAVRNSWRCSACETSSFTEKSNIYLIELNFDNFTLVKFGFSKDIDRRLSEYSSKPFSHTIHKVVEVESGLSALLIEKQIHSRHIKSKIDLAISSQYLDKSGATECYHKDMLPILIKEIEGIEIGQPVHISASQ